MPKIAIKKMAIVVLICTLLLLQNACNNDSANEPTTKGAVSSNESSSLTGTFTANGKTYTGNVSTQQFPVTGQYSVLCQDDSDPNDSKLVQFLFKDENSARAGGNLTTAYNQGKDQTATEASLTFDVRYRSEEDSKGTVKVSKKGSGNELVFDGVTLKTITKEKVVVSGKIPF